MPGLALVTALTPTRLACPWYPLECCSNEDCAPVDDVVQIKGGYRAQATFVPSGAARQSHDVRYHICRYNDHVVCVFVPLNG